MHRHCDTEDDASFLHERIRASWGGGWGSMEALGTVRKNAMCFFFKGVLCIRGTKKTVQLEVRKLRFPFQVRERAYRLVNCAKRPRIAAKTDMVCIVRSILFSSGVFNKIKC